MKIKDFYELVELSKEPEASLLPNLQYRVKKYPYFQADIFIYVKCLYLSSSEDFADELTRLAPFISDRKALFYYVMNDQYGQFKKRVEKKLSADRTNMLISAFFETLDAPDEASAGLENLILNPNLASVDYYSYLETIEKEESTDVESLLKEEVTEITLDSYISIDDVDTLEIEDGVLLVGDQTEQSPSYTNQEELEQDIPQLKHQDIIDQFIAKANNEDSLRIKLPEPTDSGMDEDELDESESKSTESEMENDFFFTQTLANIYIKQKKYERAYQIIKHLSLNYPEKNIYFADQLSFLEKVIKNKNINK